MKQFNMKESNMKPSEPDVHGTHAMGRDEAGRLYSVGMRELMKPLGVDTTAVEALAALRIAGKSLRMMQERWAETHDLSEGRLGVMFRLFRVGDCQLGDLADELDSTPRNITGLVDHLERDGLVERVPDLQDRRSARATHTGRPGANRVDLEGGPGTPVRGGPGNEQGRPGAASTPVPTAGGERQEG